MGALDPYKHRINVHQVERNRDAGSVLSESKAEDDPEQGQCQCDVEFFIVK